MDEVPPLMLARAMSRFLTTSLDNLAAEKIVLDRDTAVLCLGLIDGLVELLGAEQPDASQQRHS